MATKTRPVAIVTGASTGIGYELAKRCAKDGFDLVVAADEQAINEAADDLRALGVAVEPIQTDLATLAGVDKLCATTKDVRSRRCSPMPAGDWARVSSIKTSMTCAESSTPILPARSTSSRRSGATCVRVDLAASSSPARLQALCRAPIRQSITRLKHFSTPFRLRCATS